MKLPNISTTAIISKTATDLRIQQYYFTLIALLNLFSANLHLSQCHEINILNVFLALWYRGQLIQYLNSLFCSLTVTHPLMILSPLVSHFSCGHIDTISSKPHTTAAAF